MSKYSREEREAVLAELEAAALEAEAVRLRGQMALYNRWKAQKRSPALLRAVLTTIRRDSAHSLGKPYEKAIERSHAFGAQVKVNK